MYVYFLGQVSTASLEFSRILHVSLTPKLTTAKPGFRSFSFSSCSLVWPVPSWQDCPRANAAGEVRAIDLDGSEIICGLANI